MKKPTPKPDPHPFRVFVTGSRAYGLPRVDSDIDLVVFVTEADLERLMEFGEHMIDPQDPDYIAASGIPFRFGDLNLLCVTDAKKYDIWLKGTRHLKKQKPVTREFAIRYFRKLRKQADFTVPDDGESLQYRKGEKPRKSSEKKPP